MMKKKLIVLTLCLALTVCALASLSPIADATGVTVGNYRITEAGGDITGAPRLLQGETWSGGRLNFEYIGPASNSAVVISVEMVPDIDVTKFPFDIRALSYLKTDGVTPKGFLYYIDPIRVRSDAPAGFYDIPFLIRYQYTEAGTTTDMNEFVYMRVLVAQVEAPVVDDLQIAKVIVSASSTNPTDVIAA